MGTYIIKVRGTYNSSIFEYVLPLVLFPIGLFGFGTLKKYGWIIITLLFTHKTSVSFFVLLLEIKWSYEHQQIVDQGGSQSPFFTTLDEAFGFKGVLFSQTNLIIMCGILYVINRENITKTFAVSRSIQFTTIGISALLTSILWIAIFKN